MLKLNRIILFLALISLFTGCVTQKRCSTRFPGKNDTIRIETVRDSIVIKDTTIYVKIPGETITNTVEIPCPQVPGYVPKKVFAETSLAKAFAWWEYPNIKLVLIQKDTLIEKRLKGALREAYYYKSLYEKLHITPEPVKFIPKIYKQAMSICIVIFIAAFLFIGWKAYKFFKK